MYILKNSLVSIMRNKGRNILIGIIILVIACASTVTLAIRNTANNLVKNLNGPYSLFDININCKESFDRTINNMKLSSYGIDNFDLDSFIYEFLDFIQYKEI